MNFTKGFKLVADFLISFEKNKIASNNISMERFFTSLEGRNYNNKLLFFIIIEE